MMGVGTRLSVQGTLLSRTDGPPLLAVETLANGHLVSVSVVEPETVERPAGQANTRTGGGT